MRPNPPGPVLIAPTRGRNTVPSTRMVNASPRPYRPYEGSQRVHDDGSDALYRVLIAPTRGRNAWSPRPSVSASRVLIAPTRGRNARHSGAHTAYTAVLIAPTRGRNRT